MFSSFRPRVTRVANDLTMRELRRMTGLRDPHLARRLSPFAFLAKLVFAALGLAFLLGWTFHATALKSWAEPPPSGQKTEENLTHLSLEQLGNTEVTTVSKEPVKVARTPAAIYVITQEDIRRSGATSIPEALRLAPGVEVARIDSDNVEWFGEVVVGSRIQSRNHVLLLVLCCKEQHVTIGTMLGGTNSAA